MKNPIKITTISGVSIDTEDQVLKMLDKLRASETADGVSRAKMIRILIKQEYNKRFK